MMETLLSKKRAVGESDFEHKKRKLKMDYEKKLLDLEREAGGAQDSLAEKDAFLVKLEREAPRVEVMAERHVMYTWTPHDEDAAGRGRWVVHPDFQSELDAPPPVYTTTVDCEKIGSYSSTALIDIYRVTSLLGNPYNSHAYEQYRDASLWIRFVKMVQGQRQECTIYGRKWDMYQSAEELDRLDAEVAIEDQSLRIIDLLTHSADGPDVHGCRFRDIVEFIMDDTRYFVVDREAVPAEWLR